jgi:hypothetical protein
MLLNADEELVRSDSVEMLSVDGPVRGQLHLTNQRLIFERIVSRGFLRGETVRTTFDVPLGRIANVHIDRPILGRPNITVEIPTQGSPSFRTPDPEGWRQAIADGRAALPPPGPAAHGPAPVVVNVHLPPAPAPGTGTPPPTYLHCRFCGALNVASTTPGSLRCGGCGATL